MRSFVLAALMLCTVGVASAQMRITEWSYQGANGEFVEFTNVGATPIDMTGWSFDDDSRTPGSQSLSTFGTVNPGVSVVLTGTQKLDVGVPRRRLLNASRRHAATAPTSPASL